MKSGWVLALALLAGCGGDEPTASRDRLAAARGKLTLVGVWRMRDPVSGRSVTLRFDQGGTGVMEGVSFEWSARGGRLAMTAEGETLEYEMQLRADRLSLSGGDLDQPMMFTRADAPDRAPPAAARRVTVNQERLSDRTVAEFEELFRVRLMDGDYWYDRRSGLWGIWGGPCGGQIPPDLNLGGPLPARASNGDTGVFVNGRELHPHDVMALQQLVGVVYQGRWWLEANGLGGPEGGPPAFNLVLIARQRAQAGGNPNAWIHRSGTTDIGAGGDGNFTYVIGKDWSVTVGE